MESMKSQKQRKELFEDQNFLRELSFVNSKLNTLNFSFVLTEKQKGKAWNI